MTETKTKQRTTKRTTSRKPPLEVPLRDFFAGLAFMVGTTGDMHCATILAERTDSLATAWAKLAQKNDRVRRLIETLLAGGDYSEVIMVTAATVIPIAQHHVPAFASIPAPFDFGVNGEADPEPVTNDKRVGWPDNFEPIGGDDGDDTGTPGS